MIIFPNAKINLGLNILSKRRDGYHNIESLFYPIPLYDVIEFRVASEMNLVNHGIQLNRQFTENTIFKSWNIMRKKFPLPPLEIHIIKSIPTCSGLGGGSANAAFFINALDKYFALNLKQSDLMKLSLDVGSDCPFFIQNKPAVVKGRGESVMQVEVNLEGYFLLLVVPPIPIVTASAFNQIEPTKQGNQLAKIIKQPIHTWHSLLVNDFEQNAFKQYPALSKIKDALYEKGALYASMSGSGSAMFGVFKTLPDPTFFQAKYQTFVMKLH